MGTLSSSASVQTARRMNAGNNYMPNASTTVSSRMKLAVPKTTLSTAQAKNNQHILNKNVVKSSTSNFITNKTNSSRMTNSQRMQQKLIDNYQSKSKTR